MWAWKWAWKGSQIGLSLRWSRVCVLMNFWGWRSGKRLGACLDFYGRLDCGRADLEILV